MIIDNSTVETSLYKNTNVLDKISESEKLKVQPFSMYDKYKAPGVYCLVEEFVVNEISELTSAFYTSSSGLGSRVLYACNPKLTKHGIMYVSEKLLDDLNIEPSATFIRKYTKFFHIYYYKIGR